MVRSPSVSIATIEPTDAVAQAPIHMGDYFQTTIHQWTTKNTTANRQCEHYFRAVRLAMCMTRNSEQTEGRLKVTCLRIRFVSLFSKFAASHNIKCPMAASCGNNTSHLCHQK